MALLTRPIQIEASGSAEPIRYFKEHHGSIIHFKKKSSFVRYIGYSGSTNQYLEMIRDLEETLHSGPTDFMRLSGLERLQPDTNSSIYVDIYERYQTCFQAAVEELSRLPFPFIAGNQELDLTIKRAYAQTVELFQRNGNASSTVIRNFAVKMLYWADKYLPRLFTKPGRELVFPKLLWIGKIKEQEYLFLYFLYLSGCDILYLNPQEDIRQMPKWLSSLSVVHELPNKAELEIPEYRPAPPPVIQETAAKRTEARQVTPVRPIARGQAPPPVNPAATAGRKLSYEELAQMSPSIVMIRVYDRNQECFKTGSGVVINEGGYILTNFHVAREGACYGIRLENENREYLTDTLIKYHAQNDLALIRIDKATKPIRLIASDNLVRGQQVVAIGSPLGLFNTISDGIISGFRHIDGVNIIQFTAPVSHGSSGGALLDLYGGLAGITTGGYDNGQNLNLAVHASEIRNFLRGFL